MMTNLQALQNLENAAAQVLANREQHTILINSITHLKQLIDRVENADAEEMERSIVPTVDRKS